MVEESMRADDVVGNSIFEGRQIQPEVRVGKYGREGLKAGQAGMTANEKLDVYTHQSKRRR